MQKLTQFEFVQQNIPKQVSQKYILTSKKIYAHNLKMGQFVVGCIAEKNKKEKTKKEKSTTKYRCVYLQILGFVDSWALEKQFLDKVKYRFQYFEEEPVDVDESTYSSVREYKKDYDTTGLSDEGFENAVYEEPILYAKKIYARGKQAQKKPFALLRATENEKLEWRDKGVITWFELKKT